MAIIFPTQQPIVFYPWGQRVTASRVRQQVTHYLDKGMFQFYDPTFDTHRVVVLNSNFEPIAEITTGLSVDTIGANKVYTLELVWGSYAEPGEKLYIAVVDANTNKLVQNFVPNGFFTSASNWTVSSGAVVVGSGSMTFTSGGGGATASATSTASLSIGKEYTFTIDVDSNTGSATVGFYNGATLVDSLTVGTNTFTFTATDSEFSIQFDADGSSGVVVDFVIGRMAFEDVTPEWISAPFCVRDASTLSLLHGCSNNDHFNLYFADTGFVPRIRARVQLTDIPPIQEVERAFLTNGDTNNHYAQHVAMKELRVDWAPGYLVNFISTLYLLDHAYVDSIEYRQAEEIDYLEDENAPGIKAYTIRLTPRDTGVSFKRVVNDPNAGGCEIGTEGYTQQGTGFTYVQQGTGNTYFPQQ